MSIVTRNPSTDDQPLPLADIASAVYNIDDHPFEHMYLTFDELPQSSQKFLKDVAGLYPITPETSDPNVYFPTMLEVRRARQERLGRTLEGVNRAIVAGMLASNPDFYYSIDDAKFNPLPVLQSVLVPEWQSHLDAYVEEIDSLIWFEMTTRKDTPHALSREQLLRERTEDVHRMLEFVLQCLQMVNEKVKREIRGEMVMKQLMQSMGEVQESELVQEESGGGHISDRDSDFGGSDGSWLVASDEIVNSPIITVAN